MEVTAPAVPVFKLPAAHYLLLKSAAEAPAPECYWPLVRDFGKGERQAFNGSVTDAREELDRVLRKSVRSQMVADVPLGGACVAMFLAPDS